MLCVCNHRVNHTNPAATAMLVRWPHALNAVEMAWYGLNVRPHCPGDAAHWYLRDMGSRESRILSDNCRCVSTQSFQGRVNHPESARCFEGHGLSPGFADSIMRTYKPRSAASLVPSLCACVHRGTKAAPTGVYAGDRSGRSVATIINMALHTLTISLTPLCWGCLRGLC